VIIEKVRDGSFALSRLYFRIGSGTIWRCRNPILEN
jgi:hypothetical protein